MKHGCMVMTLRLSSSRRSGLRQIHRGRKKRVKFAAMSSPCWSFFFDIQGIVHKEFLPPGQTVNGKIYCDVLKRLMEGIWRKLPHKWKKNNWFLHHDNAPAHTSHITHRSTIPDFQKITVFPQPPPPPIRLTAPHTIFFYSPRWHYGWKGPVLTQLRRSTQKRKMLSTHTHSENFKGCMKSWETLWDRCIHAQGDNFEGDGGN